MFLACYVLISVIVSKSLAYSVHLAPSEWAKVYPQCSGQKQSPIDIKHGASLYDNRLQEIDITREAFNESDSTETWTIKNSCDSGRYILKSFNPHHVAEWVTQIIHHLRFMVTPVT